MTAKKIVLSTLAAVLVAGAAIPAFAAPGRGEPDRMGMRGHGMMQDLTFVRLLKTADANKDGKVTKDEMTARQDALFGQMDANKDGFVSRGELLDYRTARMEEFRKNNPPPAIENTERRPEDRDRDGDRAERRHDRDRERAGWDRDGRGPHGDHRREARWDRRDGPPHGGPQGGMMRGGFFRMVDEDRDGKISKAEAVAASDKLFARMDTNKDGTISIDDLPDRPL